MNNHWKYWFLLHDLQIRGCSFDLHPAELEASIDESTKQKVAGHNDNVDEMAMNWWLTDTLEALKQKLYKLVLWATRKMKMVREGESQPYGWIDYILYRERN